MAADLLTAQNIPALYSSPEDTAVLLTVQSLLDFVSHRDLSKVRPIFYSQGMTARLRPNGMQWGSIEELCEKIAKMPGNMEEYMYNPEVRIAGTLAMVWAPCRIYIEGKLASEATNCITLHKEDETWKISSLVDTATKSLAS